MAALNVSRAHKIFPKLFNKFNIGASFDADPIRLKQEPATTVLIPKRFLACHGGSRPFIVVVRERATRHTKRIAAQIFFFFCQL